MDPQIQLDDYSMRKLKQNANDREFDEFCFTWFNGQWPDLMVDCIKAYNEMAPDDLDPRTPEYGVAS